ncbi:ABC transporter substrate-binding protein [Clostridiaceae bacterium]|nr:ABC transporter substrate-binding protein [Clostridiaceae bacterium]
MKKMKRLAAIGLAAALCAGSLSGCGKSESSDENYSLTVSGIGGSLNYLPIYIAQQEGWFAQENLEIEEVLFTNGPVQMESLSSDGWDIGCTGVGGVFAGVLGYDAKVLGSSNTDDGTQYIFARNDSDIVAAGKGHNTLNGEIYGSAETWKGKSILCNTGSVTQYVLIKMLEGFGLTQEDVKFVAMDPATAYSAFLAGEGDACVLTGAGGTFKMLEKSDEYTAVASGPLVDSGLMCSFVANKNSYADAKKYESMKVFMKVYFKSMDWMKENPEKAVQYCVDMSDENGSSMEAEVAEKYIQADRYYTLAEAVSMMEDQAEGMDMTIMDKNLEGVLDFFISVGNYSEGDDEKFKGHVESKLLKEVLDASK